AWKEDIADGQAIDGDPGALGRVPGRGHARAAVLHVRLRAADSASLARREPMIILGDVNRLHVRVDIDENDVPYFEQGAPAVATLKGRPHVRFPLEYVKIEPYVTPKKSLTGDNSERVDTRVLQAIYALPDKRPFQVYVGQQMD